MQNVKNYIYNLSGILVREDDSAVILGEMEDALSVTLVKEAAARAAVFAGRTPEAKKAAMADYRELRQSAIVLRSGIRNYGGYDS